MSRAHTDWWEAIRELSPAHRGAVLFCFYDGTEFSPGLSTLQEALAFAQVSGFVKDANDEPHD